MNWYHLQYRWNLKKYCLDLTSKTCREAGNLLVFFGHLNIDKE